MDIGSFLLVGALSVAVVGVAVLAMAIGPMFKRKCLRGSCGGPALLDAHGEAISCSDCPNRGERSNPSALSMPQPTPLAEKAHPTIIHLADNRRRSAMNLEETSQ